MSRGDDPHGAASRFALTENRILGRHGISEVAEAIWRLLLCDPSASIVDLSEKAPCEVTAVEAALDSLAAAHLLRTEKSAPSGYVANDPGTALEVIALRAERQIAAEQEQLAAIRAQIPSLSEAFETGRARAGILPGFEIITSLQEIRKQIYLESDRTKDQLRTLLHNTGAEAAMDSRETDQESFRRGLKLRSIVRPTDLKKAGLYDAIGLTHGKNAVIRRLGKQRLGLLPQSFVEIDQQCRTRSRQSWPTNAIASASAKSGSAGTWRAGIPSSLALKLANDVSSPWIAARRALNPPGDSAWSRLISRSKSSAADAKAASSVPPVSTAPEVSHRGLLSRAAVCGRLDQRPQRRRRTCRCPTRKTLTSLCWRGFRRPRGAT